MDTAADGLLALSNTAAAIANNTGSIDDGDRSSSLSELDDAPEVPDLEDLRSDNPLDGDSEAETERMELSPDKIKKTVLEISPSKLIQSMTTDDRPEIEALTNSDISSPISPLDDSAAESDPSDDEEIANDQRVREIEQTKKRKRLSDGMESEDPTRIRRRRTGSVESDEEKSDADDSDIAETRTREHTAEPGEDGMHDADSDKEEDQEDVGPEVEQIDTGGMTKSKKASKLKRIRALRGKDVISVDVRDANEDNELEEGSDDEVDIDDADVAAKSEEEQATRAAAMEALTALERHFAKLRDKLYDEKLTQVKRELTQLAEPKPCHPELLRQLDCVHKFRDEKFEIEQKLLVYKIGALKTKSVAERSQIHSAYFQTVRDIREKHMERISEHFYRIQKERFKSAQVPPSFTVPFPERRSQQILQQTAYNKEVSILSGVAKYRGFPAAPELPQSQTKELEEDIERMGITVNPPRVMKPTQRQSTFNRAISGPAAEEQFLEQTPWANPQHPAHRLAIGRQTSNKSPMPESYLTPASQQRTVDATKPVGSASTIVENPSAPASSAMNTPHEQQSSKSKYDQPSNGDMQNFRIHSASPSDARTGLSVLQQNKAARPSSQPRDMPGHQPSSPLQSRAALLNPPRRTGSAQAGKISRQDTSSPFRPNKESGITTAGVGIGRFGFR